MNPSGATHAMNVYTHGAVMDKSVDYYTGIQKWADVILCCSGALTDVFCSNFPEKVPDSFQCWGVISNFNIM